MDNDTVGGQSLPDATYSISRKLDLKGLRDL